MTMKQTMLCSAILLVGLALIATSGAASSNPSAGVGASFKGPVGLQLYSLRALFPKDVPGTLTRVKNYGIQHVELAGTYGLSPADFRQQLVARGLKPVAGHFPYERFRDDVEGAAREATALGLEYVGVAWIPHQGPFTEKACRDAAAVFNRAGEALSKHGLKFFYHQHGYEFEPYGQGTLMDLLMAETNRKFVYFEMDLVWVYFPGHDPVKLLKKYGSRWALVHLKDLKKGVKTGDLSGRTDVTNDVVLGTGQVPMAPILKAAKAAGVKYYFIEDESPDAAEQIPQSLKFLEQVKF
jgi:sugar phosphate isomerase/epimerase